MTHSRPRRITGQARFEPHSSRDKCFGGYFSMLSASAFQNPRCTSRSDQLQGQRYKSMSPATETARKPSRRGTIEVSGVDPSAGTGDHKASPSAPPAGVRLGQNILDTCSACKFRVRETSVLKTKVQRRRRQTFL